MCSPLRWSSFLWHGSQPALSPKNRASESDMKMHTVPTRRQSAAILAVTGLILTCYLWLFLHAESQLNVAILIAVCVLAFFAARRLGVAQAIGQASTQRPGLARLWAMGGTLALIAAFYESHFVLLMICTVLLYTTGCLVLALQFGFSGVANFAGAACFGIGSYATAVLSTHTNTPHILIIIASGVIAALVGSMLITPVLRTRGHYAALVTIAFGILFKTFIEVNDVLGGPQGLQVPGMALFGYEFNNGFTMFGVEISFYVSYALLSLGICAGVFVIVKALERSWVGLAMDVVRTDETAAAT